MARSAVEVICAGCGKGRLLLHPPGGSLCRPCAAALGSAASAARNRPTPRERFEQRIDRTGECWLWTGNKAHNGYGQLYVDGRQVIAHRFAYEAHVGPIPVGLEIDHLCNTRACVRPDHLEPVTHAENMRRKADRVA